MQTALAQQFSETAAATYDIFGGKLGKFLVLLEGNETPVYASPQIAQKLSDDIASVKKAVQKETEYLRRRNALGVACRSYALAGESGINLIALNANVPGVYTPKYTRDMRALYVLEHEIGHHVVKSGHAGWHYGECAADAYAALRHVQTFGLKTEFFKYANKAYQLVLDLSPMHDTQAVFERVRKLARTMDLSVFTLEETAQLADDIARECRMDWRDMSKLSKAFGKVSDVYRKEIGEKSDITDKLYGQDKEAYALFARETLAVMREHSKDADIIRAGKQFFKYPPMKKFLKEMAKTDPEWQAAIDFLKIRTPRTAQKRPEMKFAPIG
ncbi:MAG: hypothetical protein GC185_06085 [Alphaproteobacteria bacterium]|nr:hypothetical protein [Alphaproteobacteria bacterium]